MFPYMQQQQKTSTFSDWPKFGEKSSFYIFYLKLSTILEFAEWGNGALINATETTPENSKNPPSSSKDY